ncbi:related to chloroperoxidase [Cephalotrichum gorgonifer]|uniref:Related to chloroperoxidase n=1 Tax=Cephalotrichum gorgonifer TaxID=2041049 RepID=A0AAE8SUL4_9PEZI|nr:related to chloroperoxidase [Cephalotrichum gorgonifer]
MHIRALLAFSAVVTAASAGFVWDDHPWQRPTPEDRRSPCPLLNSLANHGFLARDGRDISIDDIVNGIEEAVNLSPNSSRPVAELAATASTTGNPKTLNLDDLNTHGVIEHDASLSREDTYFGDNHSFNPKIYHSFSKFFTEPVISIETAAAARSSRISCARAANPDFEFGADQDRVSRLETALYLAVFGKGTEGNARTKWVDVLFREERLPYREGFRRPAEAISNDDIVELADKIAAAS